MAGAVELRVPSRGASGTGALRVLCISWILSLCPSTLPLLRLMRGLFAPLLRVRSISRVTLESSSEGVDEPKLINTPFQIFECRPHGFTETVHIPSLHCSLQHLAYIETVFGQLYGISVVDHLVLSGLSTMAHGRTQNGAQTRTRERVALTVLKICFAGEAATASLFKISILSSRSDVLVLCVRASIFTVLA